MGECAFGPVVMAEGPGRGLLLFPEICTMELQLLAAGSPDLDVLGHVLQSLLGAVRSNHRNAMLLYKQVSALTYMHVCMYIDLGTDSHNTPIHTFGHIYI